MRKINNTLQIWAPAQVPLLYSAAVNMWLYMVLLTALILLYRWYRQSQILQNLSDKYVLITGCDSGFGNLAAKQLDRRGLRVLAACMTEKGAEDLKKETSSRLQTVILDVTDSQSVRSAAKWVTNVVGHAGLWGLINNAGLGFPMSPNEWQTKESFAKVLNVNLLGTIDVTLNLLPLIRRSRGRIVNVSSIAGRLSVVGGGYSISKHGLEAFSDSLRDLLPEVGRDFYMQEFCINGKLSYIAATAFIMSNGERREMHYFYVKVSVIEPGPFRTSMFTYEPHKKSLEQVWNNQPAEIKESYGEHYYQQYNIMLKKLTESGSTKIHMVSDCMEHAITAVYPWTRYSPGWVCKFFFLPISYFPTVISDYVFSLN